MKIEIINETEDELSDEIKFTIERAIKGTAEHLGFNTICEISVMIVDNEEIKEINNEYRGVDKATDVLSFPVLEFNCGEPVIDEMAFDGETLLLGDIVISLEQAFLQAEEYEHSKEREIAFLTVHSMLHLLGYDHMEEDEGDLMRAKEKEVLEKLGISRGN